ncbi:hypothetical protein MNV49_005374 [Pseudohyphozyma bogoriensis]|nr:hypothetical protein MNV49_005374 [Pseudohyphozyma bogoriensis]
MSSPPSYRVAVGAQPIASSSPPPYTTGTHLIKTHIRIPELSASKNQHNGENPLDVWGAGVRPVNIKGVWGNVVDTFKSDGHARNVWGSAAATTKYEHGQGRREVKVQTRERELPIPWR